MSRRLSNFLLILMLIVGLSLVLYPSFSNWWNSMHQSRAMASYTEEVDKIDPAVYEAVRASAQAWNQALPGKAHRYEMTEEELAQYNKELNLTGNGIMGIIEIPTIDVELPIYHGTSEGVLQVAIGHIEGTSLPVGGPGTHCAVSGHRGLPSARLFTDLDKLQEGDTFLMRVLDQVLTYEIDQILIVKPWELDGLEIIEGEDHCTLVTCTPYGINSHRMLVRGTRIETIEEKAPLRVTADAIRIDPIFVASILGVPVLLLLALAVALYDPKPKHNGGGSDENAA